jgi:DNA-binding SARP family transcriptional activator
MTGALRRGIVRLVAAVLLLAITIGLPVALVEFVGWPLPRTVPTGDHLRGWLTSPLSDTVILNVLAVAAWLLWAAFVPAVAVEVRAARLGLPTAATGGATLNPLRIGAAALITALTLGGLPTGVAGRPAATSGPVTVRTVATAAALPLARGPATVHVGAARYSYVVDRGDTLSGIAATWLGDAARWPEICRLNWHRHWPAVGGQLTDCDLIYPGWQLRLPIDATPPHAATPLPPPPATVTTPVPTSGHETGGTAPTPPMPSPSPSMPPTTSSGSSELGPTTTPTVSGSAAPTAPNASAAPPDTTAPPTPSPAPTPTSTPTQGSGIAPTTSESAPRPAAHPAAPAISGRDGITLPGGFIPWTLAAAIGAAVALVWLQRRRRHTPGAADDDPTDLPEPILHIAREAIRHPDLPTDPDLAERAARVPDQTPLPPGGLGLIGEGAPAAARAALASVLSSGGPRDPDRQGEVIIDGTTLTTLIGVDAAGLGPWPRLHVADDLEHALAMVETRLLHRARLLDEYALTDLDSLRENASDEEPLPSVLLVTETPPPGSRMRVRTALALGSDVEITAVLLGEWAHGTTIRVDADGHTRALDVTAPDGVADRIGVLDTDTAVAILATLREAHTGQRPAIGAPPPGLPARHASADHARFQDPASAVTHAGVPEVVPVPDTTASDGELDSDRSLPPSTSTPRAQLRVFGTPRVDDVTTPGQPLRAKAAELAVFLACHPEGADTRTIGDHLERAVRSRSADVRVHTNVSNLRHVMGRATGPRKIGYVTKPGGQYRLDPTTVDVDLWQLRDLTARAATAPTAERIRLLRQACDLYTAPLADGCDYDWVEPHREKARQQAADAHLLLADTLLDADDPQAASDTLDRAIRLDRYNENLYRKAMHARHSLGDRDGIRALLHALTVALADLDAEPDEDTRQLAQQLRNTTRTQGPPTGGIHRDEGLASTEILLASGMLMLMVGVTLGVIIAKVSQRVATIEGVGHAIPDWAGLTGGLLAGAALALVAWWATGIVLARQDRREQEWRDTHRDYITQLQALGVPAYDCHPLHRAGVTAEAIRPWAEHGITNAFTWQLVNQAALTLDQAKQWTAVGLDARFAAAALPIGATLDQVRDLVRDYFEVTGHRADLDNAWLDLADTIDCHLGPTGPRNAHELALTQALSLPPAERL